MENAEEIGLSRLAAAVIYEMTFCGFMDEEVEAERQKLQEAIEESEAVKKLSEEEQKKHFKSIEAVFAEFGWQDKRTEEEKWKDRFRRDSEIAENTRQLIRIFRK
jgi:tellurite resistance protein